MVPFKVWMLADAHKDMSLVSRCTWGCFLFLGSSEVVEACLEAFV